MAKKKHRAIPLTGASKILRAHSTQIDPPGLLELKDLFISRSDNAISLRSDFEPAQAGMFSYSSLIQGSDAEDYLNTAYYVDRAGHTIWISRHLPFTWEETFGPLYTIYEDGTITTDGVKAEVIGQGTSWLQQIWPGCMIRRKGESNNLYKIIDVTTNTRLVTEEVMPSAAGASYEILRVHPAIRADWPIRLASLGGYLVYGTVDISQPISEEYISGPFYSNIGRPSLGVWFGTEPEFDDELLEITSISVGFDEPLAGGTNLKNRMGEFDPVIVAGSLGALFSRNWIGDDLRIAPNYPFVIASSLATRSVSSGVAGTISYCKDREILTLDGEIVSLTPASEILGGGFTQYGFTGDDAVEKLQPFGARKLFGKCGQDYYVGGKGLVGLVDGTTYTTGVTTDLKSGISFFIGFGTTEYFVVVGDADSTDGVILYFTNPASISRATTSTSESFTSVCYSPYLDRVCAVGTNGECQTSDDQGATWTSRSVGTTEDLTAVAADAQGRCFCAVGRAEYGAAQCFVSMDGITWTQVTGLGTDDLVDVTFNDVDGAFYVVSGGGDVYRVRRRIRFSAPETLLGTFGDASDYVTDVQHDGSQFVAVGSKIWTSPDAITWTLRCTPNVTEFFFSVAKDTIGGSIWVAVGNDGLCYRSTDDAVTWTSVSTGVTEDLNQVIYHSIDTTGIDFIAAGNGGTIIRSTAGTGWATMTVGTTDNFYALATDRTNPTSTQKNLYAATRSRIFVNRRPITGGYDGWEEVSLSKVYFDRTSPPAPDDTNFGNRRLATDDPSSITSLVGLIHQSPSRVIYQNYAKLSILHSLDDFQDQAGYSQLLGLQEYYNSVVSTYFLQYPRPTLNSLCVANPSAWGPTVVSRLYSPQIGDGQGGIIVNQKDGILTSTDGITWSTDMTTNYELNDVTIYALPQTLSYTFYRSLRINDKEFAPICTDGTDVFIVQSSNVIALPPRSVVMGSLELDTVVEEIE